MHAGISEAAAGNRELVSRNDKKAKVVDLSHRRVTLVRVDQAWRVDALVTALVLGTEEGQGLVSKRTNKVRHAVGSMAWETSENVRKAWSAGVSELATAE